MHFTTFLPIHVMLAIRQFSRWQTTLLQPRQLRPMATGLRGAIGTPIRQIHAREVVEVGGGKAVVVAEAVEVVAGGGVEGVVLEQITTRPVVRRVTWAVGNISAFLSKLLLFRV